MFRTLNLIIYKLIDKSTNLVFRKSSLRKTIIGKNNIIKIQNTNRFFKCYLSIIGDNNYIEIGNYSSFQNVLFKISGSNHRVRIDENVHFNRGGEIWIEDTDCKISIGKNSTFENVHIAVTEPKSEIIIGSDCMFAYDIDIRTGDSHSILDSITKKRLNYAKNVNIENHVWVAAHCSIFKGVQLPCNCIVASRSVVTHSFTKSNIIIGGSPAKILKENVTWDRERIYEFE